MTSKIWAALALLLAYACTPCAPAAAAITATVAMPQCLNAGGALVPCIGAVSIDPTTGNPYGAGASAPVTGRGGSTILTGQVAVGTTATPVVASRPGRQKVIITSTSATVFYWGAAGVTAATGSYVGAVAGASVTIDTAAAVYAVGASALTVSYAEIY